MGRKRKAIGFVCGAVKKKRKVEKKDEIPEEAIFAIKMAATTAVRPYYHDTVLPWISKISITATKICELASLLFLSKIRQKDEEADLAFFAEGDGEHIIENCFFSVLRDYKNDEGMEAWFREFIENELEPENKFQWPHNGYFGNYMKYLYQQYARNVVTNLTTHAGKRLHQFFKMIAFHQNLLHFLRLIDGEEDNAFVEFDEFDVKNAVNWAMRQYDSTRDDPDRLEKRTHLLNHVQHGRENIAQFTRDEWFASLPMWLDMQKRIDVYHQWYEMFSNFLKPLINVPKIKNLSVIPICSHLRKAVKIDSDVLYRMLCETKLITKDENGIQHKSGFICQHKEQYFNEIFNIEHINRVLKANKQFRYHVVSDGVSVSILYNVPKNILVQLENDELVRKKYYDGFYVYELGIDPGMKTWNATVRRHIDSGKEVRYKYDSIVSFY